MSHKPIAFSFLNLASSGQVKEAYEKHVAPMFKHHNQHFKGDRQSLLEAMEQAHKASPNRKLTVKHSYEDRDTVITHSEVLRESGPPIAVVHIFRFENGKIAEFWDLGQEVSPNSPNENGPF